MNIIAVSNFLVCLIILLQDTKEMGVLHSPLYKYLIAILLAILIVYYLKKRKAIRISIAAVLLIFIIYIYALIMSFNSSLFVPMVFLPLEILAFKLYIGLFESLGDFIQNFLRVVFVSGLIISVIGLIQVIAYGLGIRQLYDFSLYGIEPNFSGYFEEGRFYSIYAEPAHLCAILSAGIFMSLYNFTNEKHKKFRYLLSLLVFSTFGYFTGSVITYGSIVLAIVLYVYYYFKIYDGASRRRKTLISMSALLVAIISLASFSSTDLYSFAKWKIDNLIESDNTSMKEQSNTTYALKSNLQIAVNKISDGYILGTGIFTHEQYYPEYIDKIYHERNYLDFNAIDAASLFIRILSELGIFIFVAVVIMMLKYVICFREKPYYLLIALIFITQSARLGEYNWILILLPFVVIVYALRKNSRLFLRIDGENDMKRNYDE